MNNEKLARLQNFCQGEVTFEQLEQIMPTESSYLEHEKDKLFALAQYQLEQQKALARVINQIRELLNLDDIFRTTTREVCQLLEADRVAVYRFTPNWGGEFVAEFVTPGWVKLVGPEIKKIWEDSYLQETRGGRYRNNETFTVDDIYKVGHRPCHIELLEQFQARAYIIVPVLVKDRLWGLLAAYQNSGPRCWQAAEVNLLVQIGVQFGVAVLQAELLAAMQAEVTERKRAETALRQAEHKYRTIFENAVEGIFQSTPDGHYLNANPALAEILGYASPEELLTNLSDIGQQLYVEPNRRAEFIRLMQEHNAVSKFESQIYRKDGSVIWISENARAVYDKSGALSCYEGCIEDITSRKRAEETVIRARDFYITLFEEFPALVWRAGLDAKCDFFNKTWLAFTGRTMEQEIGDAWLEGVHPHDLDQCLKTYLEAFHARQSFKMEYRLRRYDGEYRWLIVWGRPFNDIDGKFAGFIGSCYDTTERKQAEERLHHNAFHDALTGLPNRALFMDRLKQTVKHAEKHENYLFAVLFLDLDRFKVVNDSLGHMIGDQLLIALARRLSVCLRAGDTIARLGGDEFAILLNDIKDINCATYVASRIKQELVLPFTLSGREIFTSASIGIVLGNRASGWLDEILRNADIAMYQAKAQGKARYEVFDTTMCAESYTRLHLETDLRQAIERQEFRVYYQPIVSLETGRITGFEALVRWEHPTRGLISPADFIPVAEETGLIVPLGQWVLQEACRQMHEWQVRFPISPPLTISVNLSVKQFKQLDLASQVAQILQETNLDAASLRLEITESVLIENAEFVTAVLLQLKGLGVLLSLDDFGTGYSSLSYLHRFPISSLKIDRYFVSRMGFGDKNSKIVQAITLLAQALDIDVIAEGIETVEQQAQLSALHCKYGQGYLFSKPLDSAKAGALISLCVPGGQRTTFEVQSLLQLVQNQDSSIDS